MRSPLTVRNGAAGVTNPAHTKVPCGFHRASDGSWWAVQDFQ